MRVFRILIVEDNYLFRQTILDILASQFPSMILEEAGDGKTALEKIEETVPDLVFMDIKLPGENGLELTKRIKNEFPDVTVVILSGYDFPEYREAAHRFKADHFISKGSTTKESILKLVSSIVSDRKSAHGNAS